MANGVDALARADFVYYFKRVYRVELDVLFGDSALHFGGEFRVELFGRPVAVQKEHAAVLNVVNHVVVCYIGRVMARDEVRLVDEVGGLYRHVAEAQVRDCKTARLFGVVEEVALRVFVGVVADNLNRVFVCADRAVAAQSQGRR